MSNILFFSGAQNNDFLKCHNTTEYPPSSVIPVLAIFGGLMAAIMTRVSKNEMSTYGKAGANSPTLFLTDLSDFPSRNSFLINIRRHRGGGAVLDPDRPGLRRGEARGRALLGRGCGGKKERNIPRHTDRHDDGKSSWWSHLEIHLVTPGRIGADVWHHLRLLRPGALVRGEDHQGRGAGARVPELHHGVRSRRCRGSG